MGTVTTGDFEVQATFSGSITILVDNFQFYQCPGFFELGNLVGTGETDLNVPSLLGKALAGNGDTETYTMTNLQNYVYVMNGGNRTDLAGFDARLPQLAIQDGLDASDTDILGDITSTVTIDGAELTANNNMYLTRRWEFTNTGDNGDALVRFFITQTELESLKTASNNASMTNEDFLATLTLVQAGNGETPVNAGTLIPQR